MGQKDSKVLPEDGNLENDQQIESRVRKIVKLNRSRMSLSKALKAVKKQKASPLASDALTQKRKLSLQKPVDVVAEEKQAAVEPVAAEPVAAEPVAAEPAAAEPQAEAEVQEKQLQKTSEEEEKAVSMSAESDVLGVDSFDVDYKHVHAHVTEWADHVTVTEEHSAKKLMTILDEMKLSTEEMTQWSKTFVGNVSSINDAKSKLQSVVDYAEGSQCTPAVQKKLRVVTKMIMESEQPKDKAGIVLLLASHGNVCHVMKEVAINNAYGMMTGRLAEYVASQTLKEQILKVLMQYRVLLTEKLFHSLKFSNNTHYIAGFHNTMAKEIGVVPYNDPNICYPSDRRHPGWKQNLHLRFFAEQYTKDNILKWLMSQIKENKIPYQKVVTWFEKRAPVGTDKTDFLHKVIDVDTGNFNQDYVCWMLEQMDIFLVKDDQWKPIEKSWK